MQNRRVFSHIIAISVIFLSALVIANFGGSKAYASTPQTELIPAYIYPANLTGSGLTETQMNGKNIWHHLCDTTSTEGDSSTIIADPGSPGGPGSSYDSNYGSAINHCVNDGVNVIGYVYTDYGARSLPSVEADVAEWVTLYGDNIEGIFIDQVPTTTNYSACPAYGSIPNDCEYYYSQLNAYIQSEISNSLIVANMGAAPTTDWPISNSAMSGHPFDLVNIFEGPVSSFTTWSPPSWVASDGAGGSVSATVYQDYPTSDTASADASTVCTQVQNQGIQTGVAWSNTSGANWSSDPTTVTGNGIWDDLRSDGC
jgi:hypothetical protein